MEKNLFRNLKAILVRYRWNFFKAFLMVLISNCLLILNPLLLRQAVSALDSHSLQGGGFFTTLIHYFGSATMAALCWGLLFIVIAFLASYFKYHMRYAFFSISREAERDLRSKLFARIQHQSMAFYDQHGIGELLSRLTNDISTYREVLGPGIMYPLFFLTLIIPGMLALFSISAPLAALSLAPLILIPILNVVFRRKIYSASLHVQKGLADMSNMVQEQYSGIRIVKSYVIEGFLSSRFYHFCQNLISLNFKLACYQGMLFPFFTLLTKVVTVLLVMFSAVILLQGWSILSAADFVSFMWIQSNIFFPVLMLAWVIPIYERGRAAYDRLLEIYEEPVEVQEGKYPLLRFPKEALIEFHHLTFRYPKATSPALTDITLSIKAGSLVGITGPVGGGKTTLFRLLNREYEIPEGMIAIGGRDIHDYPLEAFGEEIAIVEQAPFLFSRSIAENVRVGKEDVTLEDLETVSRIADLHETIQSFPKGYETVIGERGVTLSGGQKQRLAMARAFLVNRSILLLDDVFSALDTSTEQRIFNVLLENFKDKTILLVTHRVSILEKTDRVLFLKNGVIVEDGAPEELRQRNGAYAALAELQRGT